MSANSSRKGAPPQMNRITDIEQQIAHLRWRRIQSERAIKASLDQTKILQENDVMKQLAADRTSERRLWVDTVLSDEFVRPLVLNDKELTVLQREDIFYKKKLQKNLGTHLDIIRKLKVDLQNQTCNFEDARRLRDAKLSKILEVERDIKRMERNPELSTSIRVNSTISRMNSSA